MSMPPPGSPPSDFPAPGNPGAPPPPPPGSSTAPPGYASYTPHNPGTAHGRLSSFGRRLAGFLIDSVLYGLASLAASLPGILLILGGFDKCESLQYDGTFECLGEELASGSILGGLFLIGFGLLFVAFIYVRAIANEGQTWGRKIVGLKVIDELTGEAPGWGKAIGRSAFAWFFSAQLLYIGYLWSLWDERKQTLHDKVSGTHVIDV